MNKVSRKALETFKRWGEKGGRKRARNLTPSKRRAISKHAAQMRWGLRQADKAYMPSVRLKEPLWEDPVYLEEVLSYGGLDEWRKLRRLIADRPFGPEAAALEKVLGGTMIYGTTFLWKGILKYLQGGFS